MSAGAFPEMALVADSSRYAATVARDLLREAGIRRVVTVADGAEAVNAIAQRRPDLLVLDWNLDVVGAREVITVGRDGRAADAAALPVIVTMACPVRSEVEAVLALGGSAVLAVPYSPREFRERIRHVVAAHRG